MAMATQEKGRGLRFAEQQLLRHGWEQGKGLGKDENGISEAIKVKVKCDKGGVGHKESEQFTFRWWDHVFNKTSSSLTVESGQDGVVVKKMDGEEEEGMISNKKPRKALLNKSALYGCFVKSATLLAGREQSEQKSSSSDDSSTSDDDEKLDLSSTTKISDEALMKACGGRTAHKGARHGHTMSAKLARLEQQEQEFMAKYGKKNQKDKNVPQSEDAPTPIGSTLDQDVVVKTKHKKQKKKEQSSYELSKSCTQENTNKEAPQIHHNGEMAKKQKKHSKEHLSDTPDDLLDSNGPVNTEIKKKKKRKHLEKVMAPEDGVNTVILDEDSAESFQQHKETVVDETDRTGVHPLTGSSVSKKTKRKKKKHSEKVTALEEGQNEDTTESCGQEQEERGSVVFEPASDSVPKKKKKKKSKPSREDASTTELESPHILQSSAVELSTKAEDTETTSPEREKSKSKKKRCREEEREGVVENGLLDDLSEKRKKKKKKHNN